MQKVRIFIITAAILIGAVIGVAQISNGTGPDAGSKPALVQTRNSRRRWRRTSRSYQELNAQNDEILKQQQAALEALDDCRKRPTKCAFTANALGCRKVSYFFLDSTLR